MSEKYRIERLLGMGGMGVVLAARHVTLGQRVAVKMLRPELAQHPEAGERFLREARASTNLRSQHVVRVLDVGEGQNGAPYMVMEYLEGKDLHELAQTGTRLSVAVAVEYVLQAAEALAEAHAMGLVHRDLKPANLFLTTNADGTALVKVLDFGISKATEPGEPGITTTDAVLGSPGYMAPEQIRSAKQVDQRADIWGMGVSLYELLTGAPPFDGASVAAVSVQIVLETPKLVHTLRADVPVALSDVIQRCLEKDPAKRYANMADLAEALLPFAPDESARVERIRRIVRGSVAHARTLSASQAALEPSAAPATDGNWEAMKASPRRTRAIVLGLGLALLAASLAGFYALGRQTAELDKAPLVPNAAKKAAVAPSAEGTPSPVPAPSITAQALPSVSSDAAPSPVASAANTAGNLSRRAAARPAPRPACPKGQVLSNGHCCPNGLVWQNNGCDRPLAVTLP